MQFCTQNNNAVIGHKGKELTPIQWTQNINDNKTDFQGNLNYEQNATSKMSCYFQVKFSDFD